MKDLLKPSFLRWKGPKPTLFSVIYYPIHRPSRSGEEILADTLHPQHFKLKRKFEARDRNGLWWGAASPMSVSAARTVRSWCARRVKTAFRQELAARSLNEYGRRVAGGKVVGDKAAFTGTLVLQVLPSTLTAKYAQVREEAGSVVDALLDTFAEWQKGGTQARRVSGERKYQSRPR